MKWLPSLTAKKKKCVPAPQTHPHPRPDQATTAAVTLHGTLRGWQGLEERIPVSCKAPENGDGNPKGWQVWKVIFRSCNRPFFRGPVMEFQSNSQVASPNMRKHRGILLIHIYIYIYNDMSSIPSIRPRI